MEKRNLTIEQLNKIEENRNKAMITLLSKRKHGKELIDTSFTPNKNIQYVDNYKLNDKNDIDDESFINESCSICGKAPVMAKLFNDFEEKICSNCRYDENISSNYTYINKTDAMSQYLLPHDSFFSLKFVLKDNPKNQGWTGMKLYLRKHVSELSYKRHGGEDGLEIEKAKRRKKKFDNDTKKIMELMPMKSSGKSVDVDTKLIKGVKSKKKINMLNELVDCIIGEDSK
eukprot:gene8678-11727_t